MIYKESTEYGSIGFTKKTIGKVVLQCIDEAPMKMVISNKKGKTAGFPHVIGKNERRSTLSRDYIREYPRGKRSDRARLPDGDDDARAANRLSRRA